MTAEPGDITRQWWYLFQDFPQEHRDEEIATWINERRVGALIALFDEDKKAALQELGGLRGRYPKEYARARREHRGEYDWSEEDLWGDPELTERQWEQRQVEHERREAHYEWVEEQYLRLLSVIQNRSRLIVRIKKLDEQETSTHDS